MAREPIVWRILLSSKDWLQEAFQDLCATDPSMKRVPITKGSSHMVECPWKGDGVLFVYKNKVVMSGIVQQDGFLEGRDHLEHPCYQPHRAWADPWKFTWIQITELGLNLDTGHTGTFPWKGQRMWVKVAG